ncbi:MAG: galactokinase [Candidatus Latescibacteria bacterium]|nr:galactokinase [Candidatus Latescibacterota bacterium]
MIIETIKREFEKVTSHLPEVIGRAPGRVNLIGEHTDYNDGFVLPTAIDREVIVAVGRRDDQKIVMRSLTFHEMVEVDVAFGLTPDSRHLWANYPLGVVNELIQLGFPITGFDAVITGDVPIGAGLSSSAAIEVATAIALTALYRIDTPPVELAKLCRRAENRFVGVNCGIMDQMIAVLGRKDHALFIDCRDLSSRAVPIDDAQAAIVICNSGVKRGLVDSEYNKRRAQCEEGVRLLAPVLQHPVKALRDVSEKELTEHQHLLPPDILKRCRHVISENARVDAATRCLIEDDLIGFGALMIDSHMSLRDDYEVSCSELDLLVEIALSVDGLLGARLTGAGFGGCTVNFVERGKVEGFLERVVQEYRRATNLTLEIYICLPSDGAHIVV